MKSFQKKDANLNFKKLLDWDDEHVDTLSPSALVQAIPKIAYII